jgi:hypothetical protein
MRGLHDRGDALEERHELRKRHRAVRGQPLGEGDPLHALHGDPQQAIVLLDAERVDVGGVGVVEPRRELGLAQEALHDDVAPAQLGVQDLDDRFSSKQWLLAAIHGSETAFADPLAKHELSNLSPGKVVFVWHPRGNVTPAIRRWLVCMAKARRRAAKLRYAHVIDT